MIKYTWNYALLLEKGSVKEALVPSPLYIGMEQGILTRLEEITRCPAEIQDSLSSLTSFMIILFSSDTSFTGATVSKLNLLFKALLISTWGSFKRK